MSNFNLPPGVSEMDEHINPPEFTGLDIDDTTIETWFERDCAHVCLAVKETDDTIIEWWDESVSEMVEDGFLDSCDWHQSAYDYAVYLGII